MSIKPIVALALPSQTATRMFRPQDLATLCAAAEVIGPPEGEDYLPLINKATVAITGWGTPQFTPDQLDQCPNLKLIAHSAGSVKHLATAAVYARGIRVTSAADANAVPVAQLTVGMMLVMLKQVPWLISPWSNGDQPAVEQSKQHCRELMDLTVGLIGASRIGREVIRLLSVYPGLTIKLYDPYLTESQAASLGVQKSSLDDVCRCEVVSLHAPNIPETRHMMNARTLSLIPDHGIFINTSRGALVDEAALVAEVRRRPLYVWLDVTDPEPPPPDSPLRSQPTILLTPHVAGSLQQACKEMGLLAITQTLRFLRQEPLTAEITEQMLPTQA